MIPWLTGGSGSIDFPDPESALKEPDGLLAAGGDLSVPRLLSAYSQGIFPWYEQGQPILWWCPDPRAVLYLSELRVSRTLRRSVRNGGFHASLDNAFEAVIEACARRDGDSDTWITPQMASAFSELHAAGHAHSVEVWKNEELVGGLYGVAIGRVFFGESMFSAISDASKVALVHLVRHLSERNFRLIDCQIPSQHLTSLGSRNIPRSDFLEQIADHIRIIGPDREWKTDPEAVVLPNHN